MLYSGTVLASPRLHCTVAVTPNLSGTACTPYLFCAQYDLQAAPAGVTAELKAPCNGEGYNCHMDMQHANCAIF